MKQQPLLSICCITYNHLNFIEQAIESFLMQKTTFSFEIIINDDCSTDGTTEILKKYEKKYPELIFPIYHAENEFSKGIRGITARNTFPRARGKYIALCEGDDYWTDPLKLQKQVDFLEKNENINLCFHQVNFVDVNSQHLEFRQYQFDGNFSQYINYETVLANWCITTCSIVFRKTFERFPSYFMDCEVGDQPLSYFVNLDKSFYYIADVMASYRITDSGYMGTLFHKKLKSKMDFPFLDKINELSNKKYNRIIQKRKRNAIIRDLKLMKNSKLYSFRSRIQFYIRNCHFFLREKNGIKIAVFILFKYVI